MSVTVDACVGGVATLEVPKAKLRELARWRPFARGDLRTAFLAKVRLFEPKFRACELSTGWQEYLRLISVMLTMRARGLAASPSGPVDVFWHSHLLFTQSYWDEMCTRILGGVRIHHNPAVTRGDRRSCAAHYRETLVVYRELFGEPPARWWPAPTKARGAKADCESNCKSCSAGCTNCGD